MSRSSVTNQEQVLPYCVDVCNILHSDVDLHVIVLRGLEKFSEAEKLLGSDVAKALVSTPPQVRLYSFEFSLGCLVSFSYSSSTSG